MNKFSNHQHITFILAAAVFFLLPIGAHAVTLEIVPHSRDIYQNESFIADIVLDTEGTNVNAVELELVFPSNILEVLDISRGGSVISLWIEDPYFSNTEGSISFIGGMPGGFVGEGIIGSITLLAKNTGDATVSFLNAQVLLNDGAGTEALLTSYGKNFFIMEQVGDRLIVFSSRHPNQNTWYSDTALRFQWDVENDVVYRYILSQDPDAIPHSPEGAPVGDIRFLDIGEGVFYFILTQKQSKEEKFGSVSRYRVMIDNTPPAEFELKIVAIDDKKFIAFSTTDAISGVSHYEILKTEIEGAGVWRVAETPYLLEETDLRGIIKVKAVDKAGNEQIVELQRSPRFTLMDGLYLFLIFTGLLLISWIWHKRNAQ